MIIGLDIGGTNIDTVIVENGRIKDLHKTKVDKKEVLSSILLALRQVISNVDHDRLERIVLSTTITTNAIVQSKNNQVGVIVEPGPGRKLELRDEKMIPFFIDGYIDHRGKERYSIDKKQITQIKEEFKKQNLKYGAVISKFSVRNPKHEDRIAEIINQSTKFLSKGHTVSGELNFPRRINTAFLNSSVYEKYFEFVRKINNVLKELNVQCPVYVLKADGGSVLLNNSISRPVETILSGPAASIMGAINSIDKDNDVIVFDIGGTTTDISFLANGVPLYERKGVEISQYKTLVKGLYSRSVGIGGDSLIKLSDHKLKLGPQSGHPACFGGESPTPTDAMCILGEVPEGDLDQAVESLKLLAKRLNIGLKELSRSILNKFAKKIVDNTIYYLNNINSQPVYTIHDLLYRKKLVPQKVIIMGGPALVMEEYIKKYIDQQTIVPDNFKVANSLGAALSRVTTEMTITADTSQGYMLVGEQSKKQRINKSFTIDQARDILLEQLLEKAKNHGFSGDNNDLYIVEEEEFNIVRRFNTKGKFIRIKARVKPGIKEEFSHGKSE